MNTGRRRRRLSLRARITAGALLAVLLAVCGAGIAVVEILEREMIAQIDETLTADTDFINRAMTSTDGLPTEEGPTDLFVQFLAADGQVIGASDSALGIPPLVAPSSRSGPEELEIVAVASPELGELRVLAQGSPPDGAVTLVVARSAANVAEVRDSLTRLLVGSTIVLTVLLGGLVWVVVGRALRPVGAMARTVNGITDRELHERVDPPGTRDELDRLAETLNNLLGRLDIAVAREREFVSDASHELRTPIAAVRALLETEPEDPVEASGVRAEALMTLWRLEDLVDELLTLTKADAETARPAPQPVDLDELVLEQARRLEHTTTLLIDISRVSGGQVLGRDTELSRLVENLASNATRFATSTVAFSVQQRDGQVEFMVSDDGPGIATVDRARIFERFTTLDSSRSVAHAGAGLGLSIASAIVASHHGSIAVDDAPGGGAQFTVRLPALAVPQPATSDT